MLFGAPRQRQRLQKSKLQMTKTLSRDSVNQRKACVVLWFFSFQDTFISIFFPKCVSTPQSEESSPAQNVATRQTNLQLKVVNKEGLYPYFCYTTLFSIKRKIFIFQELPLFMKLDRRKFAKARKSKSPLVMLFRFRFQNCR